MAFAIVDVWLISVLSLTIHRLYLATVIRGLIDHETVKISIYVIDGFYKDLRWRARHHIPRTATLNADLLNDIEAS